MVSSKELEQFHSDIQKLLEPLEAEIQLGVNLTEEDFNKDTVKYLRLILLNSMTQNGKYDICGISHNKLCYIQLFFIIWPILTFDIL